MSERTFKDSRGQVWLVRITLAVAVRLREQYGVDITKIYLEANELSKLVDDPAMLGAALFESSTLNGEKAESFENFAEALGGDGDVIDQATQALMRAVIDSFPNQNRRKALESILTEAERATDKVLSDQAAAVMTKEAKATIESMARKVFSGDVSKSADSSD